MATSQDAKQIRHVVQDFRVAKENVLSAHLAGWLNSHDATLRLLDLDRTERRISEPCDQPVRLRGPWRTATAWRLPGESGSISYPFAAQQN